MHEVTRKSVTIVICVSAFILTVVMTVAITFAVIASGSQSDIQPEFINTTNSEMDKYDRLNEVYKVLMDEYYIEVDSETLIQGAIDGMMASLKDPYTYYYTPDEMAETNSTRNGLYVGIGVQVMIFDDGYVYVTRVFDGGPANEAGLKKGDIITSADGIELKAYNGDELTEAVSHIKGEEGTFVEICVKRGESEFCLTVERRNVITNRVEYQILDGSIGYIKLYEFFGNAVDGTREALNYFSENGVKGIIVDVRDNSGGLLDMCVDISDMFVSEGLIVYTEDRNGERNEYLSEQDGTGLPVAVLINENSASASEIFAAAVKENGAGILVGKKTFGKGIVQTEYMFQTDGAGMKLTTNVYYTPNGNCIHGLGVEPDIAVENEMEDKEYYTTDCNLEDDSQFAAAYEYLSESVNENNE